MFDTYAYFRFTRFCSEMEDFQSEINKVLSQADDALFDVENSIPETETELTRPLGYETERIRRQTADALKKVIAEFTRDSNIPKLEKKPARDRIIKRDVACRYLRIYGGETQWIQTDIDSGYPILVDKDGDKRAIVDSFDAFPKPPVLEINDDIPF